MFHLFSICRARLQVLWLAHGDKLAIQLLEMLTLLVQTYYAFTGDGTQTFNFVTQVLVILTQIFNQVLLLLILPC